MDLANDRRFSRITIIYSEVVVLSSIMHIGKVHPAMISISKDFEFIEIPAAPSLAPPVASYGVRVTAVSIEDPIEYIRVHDTHNN